MFGLSIVDIVGWTGAILVILAYLLITTRKVKASSILYQTLNFFGSIGIIVNSFFYRAYPSVIVNALWILIALYGLSVILIKKKKILSIQFIL